MLICVNVSQTMHVVSSTFRLWQLINWLVAERFRIFGLYSVALYKYILLTYFFFFQWLELPVVECTPNIDKLYGNGCPTCLPVYQSIVVYKFPLEYIVKLQSYVWYSVVSTVFKRWRRMCFNSRNQNADPGPKLYGAFVLDVSELQFDFSQETWLSISKVSKLYFKGKIDKPL